MRFGANGVIVEGGSRNLSDYRVVNGLLEFINDNGYVYSRMAYDQANGQWRYDHRPDQIDQNATFRLRPE